MMNGWKETKFKDFAIFPPKIKLEKDKEYPFVLMDEVDAGFKFVKASFTKKYNGSGARFENGDTLFARITPSLENGKIAQIKDLENPAFGSTEFFVFRGKKDISDNDFVYYLCKTDWFIQNAINSFVGASGRQRADAKFVGNTVLNLPPLPTQRKIASILSGYDDLIENNLKRIKLLEEMAQQTYEEWFVRMKFPGYETAKWNEETGLPEGWRKVKLGDYIKFVKGKKVDELLDIKMEGTAKVLLLDALENGKFKFTKIGKHVQTKRGDIMMLMDGARSSFVFYSENGIIGSTMAKITSKIIPSSLLFHFFKVNLEWLLINNTGAAIPHANKSFIRTMSFRLPTDQILRKWTSHVDMINQNIWNLKDQNQRLKEARDILLPRLMTGMIDVEGLEAES